MMRGYLQILIRHLRGWHPPLPDLPQTPTQAFDNRDGAGLTAASRPWLFRSLRQKCTSRQSRA